MCLQVMQRKCIGDAHLSPTILPRYSLLSGTAAMLCCGVLWRLRIYREACAGLMH